ncbi:2OG-Fe(II) oxygenase [Rhizorhabdus wittichii DC-6]|uniref:2OG-Fe(II) oxygenase n=2 Tax=Rhizorhabdus wittichii TaxID=160791 RepID=A0A9J9HE95_RHIWR|nr:2OG-Fe(II) oxygenase [Rhizorhabdus wittichii]ABQ69847.1 2OG-Fe(II) oxygenase [Rhizorhabdus wittichii RW1]ARR53172.1 2OG-Fe(II) oxygenase [Rhizorhabdus wittichii DC-6]QTH19549.1 2OG-Fe(II) oxygenase [Rhizorhabdus wittichii]
MNNVWEVWTSALSSEECDQIIERGLRYAPQTATVGFAKDTRQDDGYRTSVVRWLDTGAEQAIVARLMSFVVSSNRTNFGVDIVAPFDLQFTEYHGTSQGKYDWHQDVWLESTRPYDRKLSLVVQLSDPADYEGGAFEFFGLQHPGALFAPRGSLLIFPSWMQHRVLPVTGGIRRSLVSWVEGPRWR